MEQPGPLQKNNKSRKKKTPLADSCVITILTVKLHLSRNAQRVAAEPQNFVQQRGFWSSPLFVKLCQLGRATGRKHRQKKVNAAEWSENHFIWKSQHNVCIESASQTRSGEKKK